MRRPLAAAALALLLAGCGGEQAAGEAAVYPCHEAGGLTYAEKRQERQFLPFLSLVEAGIDEVEVFLVHPVLGKPQPLAEALEVDHLPGPEEPDHIIHVRVVGEPENVVVGNAGLLLCCDLIRTTFLPQSWENFLYA